MNKIFLVELETLEPVVVVAKKGKTKFVETTKYIPASSIAGALARKSIVENIKNSLGKCKEVENVNIMPNCTSCNENCNYRRIWINKELKLTNAVAGDWNLKSPGIPELQTACESRQKTEMDSRRDQLLFLFLERMFWSGKVTSSKIEEIRGRGYKKKPLGFTGKKFDDAKIIQFTRVRIDEKLRSSKEGELYGFTAIREGQRFRFAVFCEENLVDLFKDEIKIGAWKSRGLGLVRLKIVEEHNKTDFIEMRTREILEGFEKIQELFKKETIGYYGTYTYLTDGTQRPALEILFSAEKMRRFVRFERIKDKGHFVMADTISPGSAGVFYARDPEKLAGELAKFELKISSQPWFDWLFFNHPVHYEFSVLGGEKS